MPAAGDNPRKRQRVTQACSRCRSKKYRCDADGPPCGACRTAQADCSYDNATAGRRRGLRPGYVKTLEALWGSVLQSIPGSEDVANRLLARLPNSAEHTNSTNPRSPLERWQASTLPAAIDTVLDGGTLQSLEHEQESSLPPTGLTWSLPPPPRTSQQTPETPSLRENPATLTSPLRTFSPPPSISGPLGLPDLPCDWQSLLQVYLCTEYCWLPLFEKACLYRWAYSYQEHSSTSLVDLNPTCRGHYASLWAALVLAEFHSNGGRSTRIDRFSQAGKQLLNTAESVGPDFAYSTAFILWTLIYIGRQSLVLARMMFAQAVILANSNAQASSPTNPAEWILTKNACFVLNAALTFATGTQRGLLEEEVVSLDVGEVGEWDPWVNALSQDSPAVQQGAAAQAPPSRTASTYIELIKLMTILKHAMQKNSSPDGLTRKFEAWKTSLPSSLQRLVTQGTVAQQTAPPSHLNLRLWSLATSDAIARRRWDSAPSAISNSLQNEATKLIPTVLDTTVRCHGLRGLPSSTSIFVRRFLKPDSATTLSTAQERLVTEFAERWAWSVISTASDDSARRALITAGGLNQESHEVTSHASAASSMSLPPGPNAVRRSSMGQRLIAGTMPSQAMLAAPLPAGQDHLNLSRTADSHLDDVNPALTAGGETSPRVTSGPQNPISHDLLDYLTMFEGDQSYDTNFMEPLGFFPR